MSILTQAIRHSAARLLGHLGEQLVPGSCLLCNADSGRSLLCSPCGNELPRLTPDRCPRCARPHVQTRKQPGTRDDDGAACCADCQRKAPPYQRTLAPFRYAFPVDRIIHALKYAQQLPVAYWAAQQMAPTLGEAPFDHLLPLPLHPSRLRQRGFNQALEIARHLENWGVGPVDRQALYRQRPTAPQAGLPYRERAANVRGAFACSRRFDGARLLLIDDVMTSGETAGECCRVLLQHGAGEVSVAVLARALRPDSVV
jgi:ComF family protein